MRALGLLIAALRSPARNLSAPSACAAGSGASLANRITLRLVRFSLPVVGPAGAVLGAGRALPNTLLKSGALKGPDDGARGGGWALATLLGGSGLGGGGAATCGSGRGAARATVRRGAGMCSRIGPPRSPGYRRDGTVREYSPPGYSKTPPREGSG